jgi:hypothetical protein
MRMEYPPNIDNQIRHGLNFDHGMRFGVFDPALEDDLTFLQL